MRHKKKNLQSLLAICGAVIAVLVVYGAAGSASVGARTVAAQGGTKTVTPTPSPTPTQSPTPTPTPTPVPESDLDGTGLPPAGVAAILSFFTPFSGCRSSSTQPTIDVGTEPWEIAQENTVCFGEFRSGQQILVYELRPPNRSGQQIWRLRKEVASPEGSQWVYRPGAPLGEYTLLAVQGSRQAWTTFTLRKATQPHLTVLTKKVRPGQELRIAWAGFEKDKQLHVYRFRSRTEPAQYVETLPLPAVKAGGAGVYEVRMSTDAAPGTYLVHTGEPASLLWPTSRSFEVLKRTGGSGLQGPDNRPPVIVPGGVARPR